MKFHTDSHFVIGNSHLVCEDYASHGLVSTECGQCFVAMLSDGCSSDPGSDIGARLVTLSATQAIRSSDDPVYFEEDFIARLEQMAQQAGVTRGLSATLNVAIAIHETICCFLQGDGYIYVENKNGTWSLRGFKFSKNAPAYPCYRTNIEDITRYDSMEQTLTTTIWEPNSEFSVEEPAVASEWTYWCTFDAKQVNKVVVFSDGLESFHDSQNNPIHPLDLIKELTDFKAIHAGNFVKRRLFKMTKNWQSNSIFHEDDLSIAAIVVEDTENGD